VTLSDFPRTISRWQLIGLSALWISLGPNFPTLRSFAFAPDAGSGLGQVGFVLAGLSTVFAFACLLLCLLGVLFWRQSIRWLCAAMILLASVLGYYTFAFGTRFDRTMWLSIVQTHHAESMELIGWRMTVWVVLIGVVPALLVLCFRVRIAQRWWTSPASVVALLLGAVALCAAAVYPNFQKLASAVRNGAVSFHTIAPINLLGAAAGSWYAGRQAAVVRLPFGLDAKTKYWLKKPRLIVMVLGETARAQNQSLNGYERETNPRMKAEQVIYFADTETCGTATALSVPCMFSAYTRDEFSLTKAQSRETLIDVLHHAGIPVLWFDNDSGCKGVCAQAVVEDRTNSDPGKWCPEKGNCFDEVLLEGLEARLAQIKQDTLVVLHLKGSHGPAYFKRYPPGFERFKPTCQSNELSACTLEEIRNAYDNTLVYTDHVLGEVVSLLKRRSATHAPAMFYVSDHGESLGEKGLFLHGLPYSIAPLEQTRVPMLAWLSPQFLQLEKWDETCTRNQARVQRSHDHVFHTLLGLMEIKTSVYRPQLDIFAPCD
jgi:lipid A ethanolaminephosphotransferase